MSVETDTTGEENLPRIVEGPLTKSDVELRAKGLYCSTCHETFPSHEMLLNHSLRAHKYPCRQCRPPHRQRFSTRADLQDHVRTWHAPGISPRGVNLDRKLALTIKRVYRRRRPGSATKVCSCGYEFETAPVWFEHVKECPELMRYFPRRVKLEPVEFEPEMDVDVTTVEESNTAMASNLRVCKKETEVLEETTVEESTSGILSEPKVCKKTSKVVAKTTVEESTLAVLPEPKVYEKKVIERRAPKPPRRRSTLFRSMENIRVPKNLPSDESDVEMDLENDGIDTSLDLPKIPGTEGGDSVGNGATETGTTSVSSKSDTLKEIRIESVDDLLQAIDGLIGADIPEIPPGETTNNVNSQERIDDNEEISMDTGGTDDVPSTVTDLNLSVSKKIKNEIPDEVKVMAVNVQDETQKGNNEKRKMTVGFKCANCSRVFDKRAGCVSHARACSQKPCPSCGAKFTCELDVNKHAVICDGRQRCGRCRQRVNDVHVTKKHEKAMLTTASQCPVCAEPVTPLSLGQHLDTIHGGIVDLYTCDICNVQVDRHVLLERHLLVHMQDRRWYACDLCRPSLLTTDKRAFNMHLLNFHLTPDRYACNCCTDDERTKTLRTRHEWTCHFYMQHRRCPVCRRKLEGPMEKHDMTSCCLPIYSDRAFFEEMTLENKCVLPSYSRTKMVDIEMVKKEVEEIKKRREKMTSQGLLSKVDQGPSSKVDQGPSSEVEQGPSSKVDQGPSSKVDQGPSSKVDQGPSSKVDQGPSSKVDQGPSSKVDQGPSSKVDQGPSSKVDQGPSSKVDQGPSDEPNKNPSELNEGPPEVNEGLSEMNDGGLHKANEGLPDVDGGPSNDATRMTSSDDEDPSESREIPCSETVTRTRQLILTSASNPKVAFTDNTKLEGDLSTIPTSSYIGNFQLILTKLVNELPSMAEHIKDSRKCSYCQIEFPTNFLFAVHMLMMHACFIEEGAQLVPYRRISIPVVSSRLIVQGRYRCTVCNTIQVNVPIAHLLRHAQECGQCPGCSLKFPSVEMLKIHVEESDCGPGQRKFVLYPKLECRICDRVFTYIDAFDQHLGTHVVGLSSCAVCHHSFKTKTECLKHISEHTDYKPYCFTCARYCSSFWEYHEHMDGTNAQHNAKKITKCSICDYVAKSEADLRLHFDKVHLCSICGIEVKQKSSLDHHKRTFCGPRDELKSRTYPFYVVSCQVDEMRWLRRLGRDVIENSVCDVCGRYFLSRVFLRAHIRFVHPSKVECSVCLFLEPWKESLRRHEIAMHSATLPETSTQTGMVWFRCSFCTSSFTSEYARFAHEKVKHKIVCTFCQGSFPNLIQLQIHASHDHDENPYGCTGCFSAYHTEPQLTKHLAKDHVTKYACVYCHTLFTNLDGISEHAAIEHDFETRTERLKAATTPAKQEQTSSLMCQHCGQVFPSSEIRQHEKSCLTDVKLVDLPCMQCPATFHSNDALQRHQSVHALMDDTGSQTDPNITGIATMDALPNLSAFMVGSASKPLIGQPGTMSKKLPKIEPADQIENELDMDFVSGNTPFLQDDVPRRTTPQDFTVSDDDASAKIKDGLLSSLPIENTVRMIEYSCAECESDPKKDSRFATLELLNTHMDKVHNSVPEFDENVAVRFDHPSGHRCEFCGGNYPTENALQNHIDSVHAKTIQIFDCTECPVSFMSRDEMVEHMKLNHGNGSGEMECKICSWRFQTTHKLWKHWNQHHQ